MPAVFPLQEHRTLLVSCICDMHLFAHAVDSPGEPRLLVSCAGQVTFGAQTDSSAFAHTFILQRGGDVWKIASETFRCNVEQT